MAGAWIAFDNADPTYPYDPSTHAQVQTDAAGAYAVTLVAGRYDVSAQPPFSSGYATARVRGVELRTAPATFSYRFSGLKVTGVVTVPGGAPLASGAASAYGGNSVASAYIASGVFSLFLPAGSYQVTVGPSDYESGIPTRTYFGLRFASDTTLTFSLDGYLVGGTVTGPGGQPLIGARVGGTNLRARSTARTNASGAYEVYVPGGDYDWFVQPGILNSNIVSRIFPTTTVTAPQTKDFDLSGVTWSGTVRLASTGEPVPSIPVSVYGRSAYGTAYVTSGPAGDFSFVVKQYGIYDVRAESYEQGLEGHLEGMEAVNDSTFDVLVSPSSGREFLTRRQASASGGVNGSGTRTGWPSTRP